MSLYFIRIVEKDEENQKRSIREVEGGRQLPALDQTVEAIEGVVVGGEEALSFESIPDTHSAQTWEIGQRS